MTPPRPAMPYPRAFGRRPSPVSAVAVEREFPSPTISDELRLFALTFAGGFLFMAIFLA